MLVNVHHLWDGYHDDDVNYVYSCRERKKKEKQKSRALSELFLSLLRSAIRPNLYDESRIYSAIASAIGNVKQQCIYTYIHYYFR